MSLRHFILLLTLPVALPLSAQYDNARDAFYLRASMGIHQWPQDRNPDRFDFSNGMDVGYARHIHPSFNLAVPLHLEKARIQNDADQQEEFLTGGLDLLLQWKYFRPENRFNQYIATGIGLTVDGRDRTSRVSYPLEAGLNIRVARHVYANIAAQYRLSGNEAYRPLRNSLGIWLIFGSGMAESGPVADRDLDGVPDRQDRCPDEPGHAETFGCPDRDGDAVADGSDDCPDVAGWAVLRGCPDRDGDNLPDHLDRCPDLPGTDGMGGCPDTDGDGLSDDLDKCPTERGLSSNAGCPALQAEELAVLVFARKAVQFETGSDRLLAASYPVLDDIADIMRKYPVQHLRIAGHTDDIGTAEANRFLSERRAQACRDYLTSRGIDTDRLETKGFGESQPVADNATDEGRAQNRRVVFEVFVP
ncbi:MAG: hypothetical protein RLY31_113 [Bacteroidota bacterium]|jgi:outer membrane protein OmpA-like peptidoglycan-associated protein